MKKIISFMLILTILTSICAFIPLTVSAETREIKRYGQLEYTDSKYGTVVITGGDADIKNLIIPSKIEGHKISNIDNMAFYESAIETLLIEEGLPYFGNNCFAESKKLKSCDLPKSLESIMYAGFSNCENLEYVVIRNPNILIGEYAFYGCKNLKDIYFAGNEAEWKTALWFSTSDDGLENTTIHYNYKDEPRMLTSVYLNKNKLNFDVPPVVEEGRTLVPLRAIFEAMGMTVGWDDTTSTITATGKGNSISMRVNETTATVNGKILTMDVPSKVVDGRTLVPVRFIAESLGAKVEWDGENRIVYIEYTPDENYKTFIVNYSDEIEAYKFESGYYVDSSIILPLLLGYDDKYNDLSGILKIWDDEVNIGLNVPYDLTSNKEGDYVTLEIKCSDETLLKDSVYKNHYKKSNVIMTRKGNKSYINLDDIIWLSNYIIVDDNQILPDLVVDSVRTILDNDVIANPINEFGDKKWTFSGWQIGWTDKELEDYINYQEIWGDIAKCSLALFDGEGFDIFKRRINAMVDVLVMPSEEQMSDNIQSKIQQAENGDILINFGKYLSNYDDAFIEITKVYDNSPKTEELMDDIAASGNAIFTWADAYMETYEEVLAIQAVIECSEENRRIFEDFVDELPTEYKKDYSYAFEIISERLKEYENYNYGKMFLKNIAEKGGSFAVQAGINSVIKKGLENSGKGTFYDIGTFALQIGRYAIDVVANNQLKGIEKQGVFHALYDFNNIAYERYVELYSQRVQYLHDLPISYQEKLKNAAIISILSGNEARRTFVNARELMLTKSQLKKNEVGHQSLLDYCDEVDFLLNKWKSAPVQ